MIPDSMIDISEDFIPSSQEMGSIPIKHLKRFWAKSLSSRKGGAPKLRENEDDLDRALLDTLGLGLGPTISYLFNENPTFREFETWISVNGQSNARGEVMNRFNRLFDTRSSEETKKIDEALTGEDLAFFEEHGYLIVKNVIDDQVCTETVNTITEFLGVDLDEPDSWYQDTTDKHGIMVEFFNHALLDKNRFAPKIWDAYKTLLGTDQLWVSTDRVGFNPPETERWKFPGPNLHLDVKPSIPLRFGLQGILYLTDTLEDQGALTLVPGFHHKINNWMTRFEDGEIPLIDVFDEYQSIPIAANAGDFIIWHHALPHGSSPNTNKLPRIVQYINLYTVNN